MVNPSPRRARRSPEDEDLSLDKQVCFALYQCAHQVGRAYGALLEPYGLTFPQYQALIALLETEPSTVGALCASLKLETSTLTPVLKRLEASGYVQRYRDRVDERRVNVILTEKGREFEAEARAVRCELIESLGPEVYDLVELPNLLRKLSRLLDRLPHG